VSGRLFIRSGEAGSDLQSAYKLPFSTAGSGQTVAIVDAYDDPTAESDLGVYRSPIHDGRPTPAHPWYGHRGIFAA
jgi:hypothetical protein